MIVKFIGFYVISFLITLIAGAQIPVKPGIFYTGGDNLMMPEHGVNFAIPSGWSGRFQDGTEAFLMASPDFKNSIFFLAEVLPEEGVSAELKRHITLSETVDLIPIGEPVKENDLWVMKYSVDGRGDNVTAVAILRAGPYGVSAGGVQITLNANDWDKAELMEVVKEIRFIVPHPEVISSDRIKSSWNEYFKGRALKYYYADDGNSSSDFIFLCSDGMYRRTRTGGLMSLQEPQPGGKWIASGQGDSGILELQPDKGEVMRLRIEYGPGGRGYGIYLDGYRYFVDENIVCR